MVTKRFFQDSPAETTDSDDGSNNHQNEGSGDDESAEIKSVHSTVDEGKRGEPSESAAF